MNLRPLNCTAIAVIAIVGSLAACSGEGDPPASGNTGGTSTGASNGQDTGGADTGGTGTGATSSGGGTATGGGTSTGGTDTGSGGLGTGGSDDGSGGNGSVEPTFETVKLIFGGYRPDINCASSDCHSGGHEHGGHPLRLVADEQIYTILTTYISEACGNIPLVTPGDPENSALLKVLKGPCGDPAGVYVRRMPEGCTQTEWENSCVEDEWIAAVEEWISNGALED